MRKHITTALLAVALVAVPVAGFAATAGALQKPAAAKHASAVATHATRGIVKSVDDSTLVITRSGKQGEMTFALNSSTHREGTVAVGSPVSVRYREEGKTYTATAVRVQQSKKSATPAAQAKH